MKSTGYTILLTLPGLLILLAALSPAGFAQATNPVPFIQSLSPVSAAPGGSAFTLTVRGGGFVSGSVVNWDGDASPTTFVSATELTATLTAADIATFTTASITVTDPAPGGGTSNIALFPVTQAMPSISLSGANLSLSNSATSLLTPLVTGDFNGDGKLDLAVAGAANGSIQVSVSLGNGDATFQPEILSTIPRAQPQAIIAADLNGDGKLDLVVLASGYSEVWVLLGNGDGTFQSAVDYPAPPGTVIIPGTLASGDFNGDGKLDIAVTDTSAGGVMILLGNGDGTLQWQSRFYAAQQAQSMAVGDFNGDGKLDLVTAGGTGVYVLLGVGDGTFGDGTYHTSNFYPTNGGASSVVAADLNSDGKLDLAVVDPVANPGTTLASSLVILLGNGDGTFQPAVVYNNGTVRAANLVVGDFNGDGKLDVVVASPGDGLGDGQPGWITIFLGNGDGTFPGGGGPNGFGAAFFIVAGDFNGDGLLDLATGGDLAVGLTTSVSTFVQAPVVPSPAILNFGSQVAGTSSTQTLTLTNIGRTNLVIPGLRISGPSYFTQTNTCGTLIPAGAICNVTVTSTPLFAGTVNAGLLVTNLDGPSTALFTTNGLVPGPIVNPTSLAFGNQAEGTTSGVISVTVTNTWNQAMTFNTGNGVVVFGTNAADFALASTSTCVSGGTVAAGAGCHFDVAFTPSTTGTESAQFQVLDNAYIPNNLQFGALSGTGIAAVAQLSSTSLAFGNQNKGTTSTAMSVTVSNTGKASLAMSPNGITFTGTNAADFALASTSTCASGGTVAAGSSCHVDVTFKPSTAAAESATLNIADNAGNSPQTVALSGTGVAAVAQLSSTSLHFGKVLVGRTSRPETITLTNVGNTALTITSVRMGGADPKDFKASSMCGTSIAPGASCTINLSFTPRVKGTRTATLSITDNATTSPQKIRLTGTGG